MTNSTTSPQWKQVLDTVQGATSKAVFNQHFAGSTAALGDDGLIVSLPPGANLQQIEHRLMPVLQRAVEPVFGDVKINLQAQLPQMPAFDVEAELASDRPLHVRDRRKPRRYYVDNKFLREGYGAKVGPYGIAVYNVLALHADADGQNCWPSYATIAKLTGMSKRQVATKVKELKELNIVEVYNRFKEDGSPDSNMVILIDCDDWQPSEGV